MGRPYTMHADEARSAGAITHAVKRIGLTGGIASGKSTVAKMLAELGAPIVDADRLAREVVEPGRPALAAIAARWPQVLRDGALDRKALGAVVFADAAERQALERIVHPRIREEAERRLGELERQGAPLAIYEAALLFETGLDRGLDGVILVASSPERQLERLVARDGLGPEEARARIQAQLPLAEKKARATWVIQNDGDLESLRRSVLALWLEIEKGGRPAPGRA
jgi:dephospho-CoA kinase